jgi:hypothetical protein
MDTAKRSAIEQRAVVYDGFVSYSHAADGLLAPRLRSELRWLARPDGNDESRDPFVADPQRDHPLTHSISGAVSIGQCITPLARVGSLCRGGVCAEVQ